MRVVKKPEERKAEMVAAAAKLFAQQGFVRTSVSEIVSAVDVAKGLFYYYFTTKDDMVKAVVEGYCSYLGTLAGQIADGEGTAREKFAKLMHPEVWHECFTAMCDRVYTHMGPALEKMTAQALRESGRDEKDAKRLTGVALYGILMMARRGDMTLEGAMDMIAQVIGLDALAA